MEISWWQLVLIILLWDFLKWCAVNILYKVYYVEGVRIICPKDGVVRRINVEYPEEPYAWEPRK